MNEYNPKVSVIIPTYKRETKYLLRAIKSIENQTYKNIEIVVVDDNISDSQYRKENIDFMKKYKDDQEVIYYLNPQNIGGALARNNGIKMATGDFITFLDDDDEYLPQKIKKQIKLMLDEDCDMSFTNLKLVNNDKVVVDYRNHPYLKKMDKQSLLKYHIMRHLTGTPTFMYRTKEIREIGGFDDAIMGQEFYLMLKSIERDLKICYLDDCYVIAYRDSDGGISQGKNKIVGEKKLYEFKKKYFNIFTNREKMFIRFRHYAVMTVVYNRNKQYIKVLENGTKMFLSSPLDFIKEGSIFIKKKVINI